MENGITRRSLFGAAGLVAIPGAREANQNRNPFWNTTALFKTSGGHASRVAVFWHVAAGGTERGAFYGDRMSYIMECPEHSPNTVVRIEKDGQTVLDENGYPQGKVSIQPYDRPTHFERLPEALRVKSGHGGSPTFPGYGKAPAQPGRPV